MKKAVILSACRTAGGKFGGTLKSKTAIDLGAATIAEAVRRAGISPSNVAEVIMGNGWQSGVGPNPARISRMSCFFFESFECFFLLMDNFHLSSLILH